MQPSQLSQVNARKPCGTANTQITASGGRLLIELAVSRLHTQHGTFHQDRIKAFLIILAIVFGVSIFLDGAAAICAPSVYFPKLSPLDQRVDVPSVSFDQGLYEQAVKEASGLIDSQSLDQPSLGYAYCLRGNARAVLNQYAEAIADIDSGLKANPDTEGKAELYGIRANCMTALGKYSDAVNSLNQSLAYEPCGISFYRRGVLNLRLKRYAAAMKDLEQAMQFSDCPEDTPELRELSMLKLSAAKVKTASAARNRHPLVNNVRAQRSL